MEANLKPKIKPGKTEALDHLNPNTFCPELYSKYRGYVSSFIVSNIKIKRVTKATDRTMFTAGCQINVQQFIIKLRTFN